MVQTHTQQKSIDNVVIWHFHGVFNFNWLHCLNGYHIRGSISSLTADKLMSACPRAQNKTYVCHFTIVKLSVQIYVMANRMKNDFDFITFSTWMATLQLRVWPYTCHNFYFSLLAAHLLPRSNALHQCLSWSKTNYD